MSDGFTIKDSGARQEFEGGMVRDTTEGKADYLNVTLGPMLDRWAEHTTKGRLKYPDVSPGVPNWTLAAGDEEFIRAQGSALRHLLQWLRGDRDEDHAAAVFFNVNLAEYVRGKTPEKPTAGCDDCACGGACRVEGTSARYNRDEHRWLAAYPHGDLCSGCDAIGYCTREEA